MGKRKLANAQDQVVTDGCGLRLTLEGVLREMGDGRGVEADGGALLVAGKPTDEDRTRVSQAVEQFPDAAAIPLACGQGVLESFARCVRHPAAGKDDLAEEAAPLVWGALHALLQLAADADQHDDDGGAAQPPERQRQQQEQQKVLAALSSYTQAAALVVKQSPLAFSFSNLPLLRSLDALASFSTSHSRYIACCEAVQAACLSALRAGGPVAGKHGSCLHDCLGHPFAHPPELADAEPGRCGLQAAAGGEGGEGALPVCGASAPPSSPKLVVHRNRLVQTILSIPDDCGGQAAARPAVEAKASASSRRQTLVTFAADFFARLLHTEHQQSPSSRRTPADTLLTVGPGGTLRTVRAAAGGTGLAAVALHLALHSIASSVSVSSLPAHAVVTRWHVAAALASFRPVDVAAVVPPAFSAPRAPPGPVVRAQLDCLAALARHLPPARGRVSPAARWLCSAFVAHAAGADALSALKALQGLKTLAERHLCWADPAAASGAGGPQGSQTSGLDAAAGAVQTGQIQGMQAGQDQGMQTGQTGQGQGMHAGQDQDMQTGQTGQGQGMQAGQDQVMQTRQSPDMQTGQGHDMLAGPKFLAAAEAGSGAEVGHASGAAAAEDGAAAGDEANGGRSQKNQGTVAGDTGGSERGGEAVQGGNSVSNAAGEPDKAHGQETQGNAVGDAEGSVHTAGGSEAEQGKADRGSADEAKQGYAAAVQRVAAAAFSLSTRVRAAAAKTLAALAKACPFPVAGPGVDPRVRRLLLDVSEAAVLLLEHYAALPRLTDLDKGGIEAAGDIVSLPFIEFDIVRLLRLPSEDTKTQKKVIAARFFSTFCNDAPKRDTDEDPATAILQAAERLVRVAPPKYHMQCACLVPEGAVKVVCAAVKAAGGSTFSADPQQRGGEALRLTLPPAFWGGGGVSLEAAVLLTEAVRRYVEGEGEGAALRMLGAAPPGAQQDSPGLGVRVSTVFDEARVCLEDGGGGGCGTPAARTAPAVAAAFRLAEAHALPVLLGHPFFPQALALCPFAGLRYCLACGVDPYAVAAALLRDAAAELRGPPAAPSPEPSQVDAATRALLVRQLLTLLLVGVQVCLPLWKATAEKKWATEAQNALPRGSDAGSHAGDSACSQDSQYLRGDMLRREGGAFVDRFCQVCWQDSVFDTFSAFVAECLPVSPLAHAFACVASAVTGAQTAEATASVCASVLTRQLTGGTRALGGDPCFYGTLEAAACQTLAGCAAKGSGLAMEALRGVLQAGELSGRACSAPARLTALVCLGRFLIQRCLAQSEQVLVDVARHVSSPNGKMALRATEFVKQYIEADPRPAHVALVLLKGLPLSNCQEADSDGGQAFESDEEGEESDLGSAEDSDGSGEECPRNRSDRGGGMAGVVAALLPALAEGAASAVSAQAAALLCAELRGAADHSPQGAGPRRGPIPGLPAVDHSPQDPETGAPRRGPIPVPVSPFGAGLARVLQRVALPDHSLALLAQALAPFLGGAEAHEHPLCLPLPVLHSLRMCCQKSMEARRSDGTGGDTHARRLSKAASLLSGVRRAISEEEQQLAGETAAGGRPSTRAKQGGTAADNKKQLQTDRAQATLEEFEEAIAGLAEIKRLADAPLPDFIAQDPTASE